MRSLLAAEGSDKAMAAACAVFAACMNQSSVMYGVNISISDIVCIILLIVLITRKKLTIPYLPTIFFLYLSATVLFAAVIFVPSRFHFQPAPSRLLTEYIKLVVLLVYFLAGYGIKDTVRSDGIIKVYSMTALVIGVVGIVLTFFRVSTLSNFLFLEGVRYLGLMNDPNYFSIIQVSALACFGRAREFTLSQRALASILLFISILLSGSKTGIITLICYIAFRLLEGIFISKKASAVLASPVIVILVFALAVNGFSTLQDLLGYVSSFIPAFARIQYLFTDFSSALYSDGSGRDLTWSTAVGMIGLSPLTGIGIAAYSGVANEIFGAYEIAHNTYLQIFAEWGVPLAALFLWYVFTHAYRLTFAVSEPGELKKMVRDVLVVFLVGSMGISLNNSRAFWFILGLAAFCVVEPESNESNVYAFH